MPEQNTLTLIIINLLTIIPPTIMAYAVLKQSQRTDKKADDLISKTDETDRKAADLIYKTDEIHTSTDGNLTAVRKDLELANARIEKLNAVVSKLAEEAKKSDDILTKLDKLDTLFNHGRHT